MKNIFQALLVLLAFLPLTVQNPDIVATLDIFDILTIVSSTVFTEDAHFEAPKWSSDGRFFGIIQNGELLKVTLDGKQSRLSAMLTNENGCKTIFKFHKAILK